jgi:hypothetical protein
MTKTIRTLCTAAAVLGIVLCAAISLSFQDKPRESVTVTAVEVPVRVFDKNGFVSGLNKEDFEIFENGVRQDITGFESVSRAIMPASVALPEAIPRAPKPRNFLLIFNVFDYTDQVGEAIDYFFENIFGPDDRLVIIVEDKFFNIETGAGIEGNIFRLKDTLKKYKKASRWEISKQFMRVDRIADQLIVKLGDDDNPSMDPRQEISIFFDEYRRAWREYRTRMLDLDLNLYRTVINKLAKADGEKWGICFQQRNLFPRIKSGGRLERALQAIGGSMQAEQDKMMIELDIVDNFPAASIRSLFAEANITFHLLIMKSIAPRGSNDSRDFELLDVDAEYEDTLSGISRATGGMTLFSNKVIDCLKEAAAKQDEYYLLVYQPADKAGGKDREIEVKVHKEGAEVVTLKRFVGRKPAGIAISGFDVAEGKVSFTIGNCARFEKDGKNTGKVSIKATLFDDKSVRIFDEAKTVDLIADSLRLTLNFKKLQPGDYFFIMEAVDLVTGEKDVLSRAIVL